VFYLTQQGRPPQRFFGKTGFGGGHDNAAIAVVNGQYDAAANWWRVGDDSAFHRIMARGLIPRDSLRIIWTSPDIPESPWTARKELPGEMREAMRRAMLDLPNADPETFRTMTEGKSKGFVPASHQQFEGIIEMIKFNEAQRRKAS
jgi:phosphonate transport system substrate-binding protein